MSLYSPSKEPFEGRPLPWPSPNPVRPPSPTRLANGAESPPPTYTRPTTTIPKRNPLVNDPAMPRFAPDHGAEAAVTRGELLAEQSFQLSVTKLIKTVARMP